MIKRTSLASVLLAAMIALPAHGQRRVPGIRGTEAPPWNVGSWHNLPEGATGLNPADLRGKIVYLYCFQSWCPGCHSHGFPTLQKMIERYGSDEDVVFVAVQTAFEGFETNTAEAAWRTGQRYGLTIPIGHDGGPEGGSALMRRYRSGGTPWTVIIDRAGRVRYNDFHLSPDEASRLIAEVRAQAAPDDAPVAIETLPVARGGQDLVGTALPALAFDRWRRPARAEPDPALTLYRWWTDGCRFCEASLPAVERLRETYGPSGLRVVAAFHPKPPGPVDDDAVRRLADAYGYGGPIAIDADWSELKRAYRTSGDWVATSVSLLVDGDGVIRFVHPGPVYFPSKRPDDAVENADYRLLERAIARLLEVADEPARNGDRTAR